MDSRTEVANTGWTTGRLLPVLQTPEQLDVYDIRSASYDIQLSVTTMTGLINRQQPRVYLLANEDGAFWLEEVFRHVPHNTSPVGGDDILKLLLDSYRTYTQGLIIYDPNCIDSINVATTLAGLRDSIVVSPALAETLQGQPYQLPVVADLRIYQWKNRVQAYRWAERSLLKEASPYLVAGLNPRIAGALRSYLVATRTFVYWLNACKFLPNILDGEWISERCLMQRILKDFPLGTIHLGWFADEGQGVRLTSKAAIPMLASDYLFNLEVWTSMQNVEGIEQPTTPRSDASADLGGSVADEPSLAGRSDLAGASPATTFPTVSAGGPLERPAGGPKAYLSFTISDGDNLQYDHNRMSHLWQDSARGTIPIGWTISPALVQAAPALAAYYLRTATPNDELVAGPSGVGYILPSRWPAKQLPAFLQLTGELMRAMNLRVIEVLDASLWPSMAFFNQRLQQIYVEALAPFGIRGVLSGAGMRGSSWRIVSGVPVLQNLGLAGSVDKTVGLIRNAMQQTTSQAPAQFLNVYILAWSMTPSDLKQVIQQLGDGYEVVTPGRLLQMIAGALHE
jgi:GxGYxYP putative glycoside hydrolase C-terminal domain/GxGYxY sequence motif in domain of unknown function N-terminal